MRIRLNVDQPDKQARAIEASGLFIRLGRDADCEIAIDPHAFPMVSGLHARIEPAGSGFVLVHVSQSNKTLVNDSAVENSVPLRAGDRVRLGITGPTVEILVIEPTGPAAPAPSSHGKTVQADYRQMALLRGTAQAKRFDIGPGGVIGRDVRAVQFHLDHPHVSRLHASLAVDRGRVFLRGSPGSETFIGSWPAGTASTGISSSAVVPTSSDTSSTGCPPTPWMMRQFRPLCSRFGAARAVCGRPRS